MPVDRDTLLRSARSLCNAFANKEHLDSILANFSTTHADEIICLEHGMQHPSVPFLGRAFGGRNGAREYFELISSLLSYDHMQFSGYFADEHEMNVSVQGKATFTWLSTGQSWDEIFTYRLKFDSHGKVIKYEVWADALAAYLASTGQLEKR